MASLRSAIKKTRILGAFVLVTGTLAVLAPVADATGAPCRVTNLRTMLVYEGTGSNLQTAIDTATIGDNLRVRGVCVGNYVTGKSLKLLGVSTTAYPTPTLDGNAAGVVLTVNAGSTKLMDLVITHGSADLCQNGGGIQVSRYGNVTLLGSSSVTGNVSNCLAGGIFNAGSVIMKGSSSVRDNTAVSGGGIYNWDWRTRAASLTMRGSSSVSGNTAVGQGGGIFNADTVAMFGSSSVMANSTTRGGNSESGDGGGGIFNGALGTVIMNGHARVSGNTSAWRGGGIINSQGVANLFLNGSSSVSGNSAVGEGGGIFNVFHATITLSGSSSVTGNISAYYGGGILNSNAITNACNGPGTFWTGTLSPNSPDDSLPPTLIAC
jgi:hypothetical protein